jgi:hypothetical protein
MEGAFVMAPELPELDTPTDHNLCVRIDPWHMRVQSLLL